MSKKFLNPYNFVRPLQAPADEAPHLLWQCPPSPHDRYTGLSGKIICTMEAKTPVFVSDSEGAEGRTHKTYRFFQVGGRDVIPASSLRGTIRSVFETVSNSRWSIFADQQLSFRVSAGDARDLIPAHVSYNTQRAQWYVELLTGTSKMGEAKPLYAAHVPLYYQGKDARFNVDTDGVEHGEICWAILEDKGIYWVVRAMAKLANRKKLSGYRSDVKTGKHIVVNGIMCATGQNIQRKRNERFFFVEGGRGRTIQLDDYTRDRYNNSIRLMRQYHEDKKTPKDELSRYHIGDLPYELLTMDNPLIAREDYLVPVYVKLNGHNIEYLAPVSIPRSLEGRTLYEVMTHAGFGHLLPATDITKLSLADRVFGWVSQEADDKDVDKPVAYKGRVRFSHADVDGTPEKLETKSLSILSSPKPTTTHFYVDRDDLRNGMSDDALRYGNSAVRLRGRKVYRQHGRINWSEAEKHPAAANSDQNRSITGAHDVGTKYTFTVSFENLQPVELGALLWVLELKFVDVQGYHRIGYGKPLGFGSVQITADEVVIDDKARRYTQNLLTDSQEPPATPKQIEDWKILFTYGFNALYGGSGFEQLQNIADLKALLTVPSDETMPIHYPRPNSNRNREGKNFEWFVNNKGSGKRFVLPYPGTHEQGLPYIYSTGYGKDKEYHEEE